MIQRHTIQAVCGIDGRCRAHWALKPAGKLIFFIHGFGGGATSSWRGFPQLLLDDSRWSGWDLFFYGYDSRRIRAGISAQLLGEQVKTLIEQSGYANEWVDWPGVRRRQDFRYCEIWFVAHSLGAPLVRQMLVDAARQQAAWLDISHLICFAPASTGARIERLMWSLGTTAGGMMGLLHAIFRYRWTVLDDLRVGSNFLKNLSHETARARACRHLEDSQII